MNLKLIFKKFIYVLFISFFIINFIGCGGGGGSVSVTEDTTTTTETATDETQNDTVNDSQGIKFLANPFLTRYSNEPYPRNVWDMQVFEDTLYFGSGNSSNEGPSSNAGPVDLVEYKDGIFSTNFQVDEEQIDLFRVYSDILYIPGHDTTESWSYGNFYLKKAQEDWIKVRSIPNALHVFDMVKFDDTLFAALGVEYDNENELEVVSSNDDGNSWSGYKIAGSGRIYSFLEVKGNLYAIKLMRDSEYDSIFKWDTSSKSFSAIKSDNLHLNILLPNTIYSYDRYKIYRTLVVGDYTLYIGAGKYNDFQPLPVGLYKATLDNDTLTSTKVDISGQVPRDIINYNGMIYLLTSTETSDGEYTTKVFSSSSQNISFEENLSFTYGTFARSFEFYNGEFYFGMGCDLNDIENPDSSVNNNLSEQCGDILVYQTN